MNDTGLSYFAVDVRYLVQHAANAPSERMDDVFEELSQVSKPSYILPTFLIMLGRRLRSFQSDTITNFLDPDIRELAFPSVQGQLLQYGVIKLLAYWNSQPESQVDWRRKRQMVSSSNKCLLAIYTDVACRRRFFKRFRIQHSLAVLHYIQHLYINSSPSSDTSHRLVCVCLGRLKSVLEQLEIASSK